MPGFSLQTFVLDDSVFSSHVQMKIKLKIISIRTVFVFANGVSLLFVNFFCLLIIGNDGDGPDSDSEKGNQRTSRKSLMRTLTNADTNNKLTVKQSDDDERIQRTSSWRHSKPDINRLRSFDLTESGQGDHALPTNATASSSHHRSRSQNAFTKLVHQSIDFARRRFLCLV